MCHVIQRRPIRASPPSGGGPRSACPPTCSAPQARQGTAPTASAPPFSLLAGNGAASSPTGAEVCAYHPQAPTAPGKPTFKAFAFHPRPASGVTNRVAVQTATLHPQIP